MTRFLPALLTLPLLVTTAGLAVFLAGPLAAQSETGAARNYLWKQCDEDVVSLDLDPVPLQEIVGPEFTMSLTDGKARVIVVIQDCPTYWFNGEEIGPTQEVHGWLSVEAPRDMRPVPGAERTFSTGTWFALFTGSTNARSRENWAASGMPSRPIAGLSLEPPGPELHGQVSVEEGLRLSWRARPAEPFARLVGVNHDVYTRDESGKTVYNRIQALFHMVTWDSPGTLTVEGGTDAGWMIRPGTHRVTVSTFRPLWAQASLNDTPPAGADPSRDVP